MYSNQLMKEYVVSTNIIASNGTTKKNLRMCTELLLKVLDIKDEKLQLIINDN